MVVDRMKGKIYNKPMAKRKLTEAELVARTLFRLRTARGGRRNTDDIVQAVKFTIKEMREYAEEPSLPSTD
jgi:hypothetical protein